MLFAYLDPGAGSMLLQVLLGGIAAGGVALKIFWGRIAHFLRFGRNDGGDHPQAPPTGP